MPKMERTLSTRAFTTESSSVDAGKKKKTGAMATLPPITAAAMATSIIMYPADVVRAVCMSNPGTSPIAAATGFVKQHGLKGFVQQGLAAEITRASFSRMIKFWLQPIVHKKVFGKGQNDGTAITKGFAGALATIPEVITISPLENIKLAEQLDTNKRFSGMSSVARHLLKERGFFGGLYCGYFGMQMRQCLWTGGFFVSLDAFKDVAASVTSNGLLQDISSGFMAGVFGTTINCWTDVVRSVIQKNAINDTFDATIPRPNAFNTTLNPAPFFSKAVEIFSNKGMGGLYAGYPVKCLHLGGSGALLAVLVPRFKEMWGC